MKTTMCECPKFLVKFNRFFSHRLLCFNVSSFFLLRYIFQFYAIPRV